MNTMTWYLYWFQIQSVATRRRTVILSLHFIPWGSSAAYRLILNLLKSYLRDKICILFLLGLTLSLDTFSCIFVNLPQRSRQLWKVASLFNTTGRLESAKRINLWFLAHLLVYFFWAYIKHLFFRLRF